MWLQVCMLLFLLDMSLGVDLTYHVEEGQNPGTLVGDIAADTWLLDSISSKDQSLIWFSLLKQEVSISSRLFNATKTGKLYTAQTLDADSLCKYNTECFKMVDVAAKNEFSFVKIIEIKVIIEDINDNQPEFPCDEINLQFSERDSIGSRISIPNAIDRDVKLLNSQITYELKKKTNSPFTLSVTKIVDGSTKLEIVLKDKLDKETKDSYEIQVIAKDGGSPPKQRILNGHISVTDANDNSPVFSQNIYNVSINNGYQRSTPIVILSATDLDSDENGKVSYHFSSKTSDTAKAYFKLNESTGEIYLLKKFPSGSKNTYKLFVKAKDGGNPSLSSVAMVVINVNNQQNNAPDIDMNFISKSTGNMASISEGVKVGSFIAYVKVTDNDVGQNGEISCNLHHNNFLLQSLGRKKYKVAIKKLIDRETKSHIDFTITCKDKGSPPLKTEKRFFIQVMDVNDVQPRFTKDSFKFLAYENEEPNFPIGFINATDPDLGPSGQLTYSLIDDNKDVLPFKISKLGFISTTQPLDREQQEIYKLKVFVKDNGTSSLNNTANIFIEVMDKNDNAPYFTFPSVDPFNLDIHYHPQSKKDITILRASDRDSHVNAFLRYGILGGNDKQLFTVNPYTGVLSFSRPVYQNDVGSYDLQFVVKDSGTPVLSATTTLSLTLTVSNKTTKMFTSVDTESDNRIHINLMIIIVVAAVIVSVAIVVSIIVCIVHKRNQKDVQYGTNSDFVGERRQSGYVCELMSAQYDIPITMLIDSGNNRNSKTTLLKRESHCNWKRTSSGIHLPVIKQATQEICPNEVARSHGLDKEEDHTVMSPDHFSEMSTMSSCIDSGHGWSEGDTVHYETLPGVKSCQPEEVHNTNKTFSSLKPKDTNNITRCSYQPNVSQNSPCNDLKSIRVTSASPKVPSQILDLPTSNSFTSYTKPLPAVPKVLYS